MATDCRSPPDSVPTGCSVSRMSMPILPSSSLAMRFARGMSMRLNGPNPLRGSSPSQKLRQTDISGTTARSWKTVAIPASRASRGEVNLTRSPSSRRSPSLCWWTPEKILMNVDLPAPLSPSTHVTWPARTVVVMPSRAMTLP